MKRAICWVGVLATVAFAAGATAQSPDLLATRSDLPGKGRSVLTQPSRLTVTESTLESALIQLYRSSGVPVSFSPTRISAMPPVSCDCASLTVQEALDRLLARLPGLRFREVEGQVLVYETRARNGRPADPSRIRLASQGYTPVAALEPRADQEATISGRVTDATTGRPLSGAAVTVLGTALGGLTDETGAYSIASVPAGARQLRAQRIGYAPQTQTVQVRAGQGAAVSFALQTQAVQLEGVVAVGYGTQRRRDVTGAVGSVAAEEIRQIPTPSVGEALKGRIPGVDIQTTGYKPGDQPRIRIRGTRSLTANNDPLIVVDGIPISGGLEIVNPNDIRSVEVLKDASATAVYGSRGANGVVLITTNRGQAGGTRVAYETYYGLQDIHNVVRVFDGPGYAEFKREAYRSVGQYGCPGRDPCAAGDLAIFSTEELAGIANGVSTDWTDLISRTGAQQSHQLRVSGGSESTRFAVSGNIYDERGVTLGTDFDRRQANLSVDHESGRFRTGVSSNLSHSVQNLSRGDGAWSSAMQISPLGAPRDADGNLLATPHPDAQQWNPLLDIENSVQERLRTRVLGNAFAEYELLDGVSLRTTLGADLRFGRDGDFLGAMTRNNRGSGNDASVERAQGLNFVSTTQMQVDRQLADAHRVNATLLYEMQSDREDWTRTGVQNLPYEYQQWNNLRTAGLVSDASSNYSEWSLHSFMGRVNYTLLDRYYLTLTGRQDCSSRLAPGNKCAFFPSAALKWRVTDEGFLQNQGLISDLSLRASYGRTGNTSISPYQTQGSLSRTVYSFNGGGAFGFEPNDLVNPSLEWEKTDQYNVGVDWGAWDNRITGSADFYVQNTFDLLLQRQLPPTSGFTDILQNVGETRNSGVELSLSTINLEDFRGLRWTTDLVWATNRNEIVSLYNGRVDDVGSRWFIGQPVRVHYDREFDGIWQLGQEAEAARYLRRVGQIRVVDQNGDGVIDDDDRTILGRHPDFPEWTGSLANRLEWGAFDLSGLVVARWGYLIDSALDASQNTLAGRHNNLRVDYWTPVNPSNENPQPRRNQESPLDISSRRFKDGSHWRVRNITLGFRAPGSLLDRLGGESLRLYVQAQDPFVFTDYTGFDPEGGGSASVPSYRMLLVGATVGF